VASYWPSHVIDYTWALEDVMPKYLTKVQALGSRVLNDLYTVPANPAQPTIMWVGQDLGRLQADPIITVAATIRHASVVRTLEHASTGDSSWRTHTVGASYFRGLNLLRRVFFGERQVSGNWKPYTRISVYGTVHPIPAGTSVHQTLTGHGGWQPGTPAIGSMPVFSTDYGGGIYGTSFEGLRRFVNDLVSANGTAFMTYRKDGGGRQNRCYISNIEVSSTKISYSVHLTHHFLPIGPGNIATWDYSVVIHWTDSGEVVIYMPGIASWSYIQGFVQTNVTSRIRTTFTQKFDDVIPLSSGSFIRKIIALSHHSILTARPGLNRTQGTAIRMMLGDVSRNFETFYESPGIPSLFETIIAWPSDIVKVFGSTKRVAERVLLLIEAISGGVLAWSFAISPTIASVKDALGDVKKLQRKYEDTLSYSSESDPFSGLPESLKRFVLIEGLLESDVLDYRITFHSEVAMRITNSFIVSYTSKLLNKAKALGLQPDPKIVWQVQPFSFVVDWFITISQFIDDATGFSSSYSSPLSTLGHSVFVEVTTKLGWTYAVYIRSDNTTDPLDLVPDAWNKASGLPPISIPLFISILCGMTR